LPQLSGTIDRWGPMTDIKVMLTPQRVAALKRGGLPYSQPQVARGLIDTGASSSAIDVLLANALGLERRGVTQIHTPSTGDAGEERTLYDACFVIGEGLPTALHLTVQVIESEFASQGFYLLIGRDVLEHCVFTYDGPTARWTLKY
jgi:hypothetical protein